MIRKAWAKVKAKVSAVNWQEVANKAAQKLVEIVAAATEKASRRRPPGPQDRIR